MPVEAGIQKALIFLGSRPRLREGQALRGNDDQVVIQSTLNKKGAEILPAPVLIATSLISE
jgi:hypothetical protein